MLHFLYLSQSAVSKVRCSLQSDVKSEQFISFGAPTSNSNLPAAEVLPFPATSGQIFMVLVWGVQVKADLGQRLDRVKE